MLTFLYDLTLQQGASFDRTLRYSTGVDHAPVDLSGCTAWLVIRRKDARHTSVLRLDNQSNGGLQVGVGFIRIMVQRTQSQKFVWDAQEGAEYACFVQYPVSTDFPAGYVQKLLKGDILVEPGLD